MSPPSPSWTTTPRGRMAARSRLARLIAEGAVRGPSGPVTDGTSDGGEIGAFNAARLGELYAGLGRGRSAADNRQFIDAIQWMAPGATPWRDLPPELGHWKSLNTRYRRWTRAGVRERLFRE
ncbi:transposase, partial [Paracoccus sp. APAP_BH8]|uniref:transposase n=1 Tax=Paracoccus sp. APAP_BH8 TaxID=3110237 RepID=UPI002FD839D8